MEQNNMKMNDSGIKTYAHYLYEVKSQNQENKNGQSET